MTEKAGFDSSGEIPIEDNLPGGSLQQLTRSLPFQDKPMTPKFSAFDLDKIGLIPPSEPKAFKLIQFDAPSHRRERTAEPKPELNESKESFFTSTVEPKSSYLGSEHHEECHRRTTANFSHDFDCNELVFENTDYLFEKGKVSELGFLPTRTYCYKCKINTSTVVSLELPTLPFWKIVCCVGDLLKCCSKPSEWDQFEKIHHRCRRCRTLLGTLEPITL